MSHGNRIFAFFLLLVVILFLIPTLGYTFKAKVFPLIALLAASILLVIQISREFLPKPKEKKTAQEEEAEGFGRKHLAMGAWMVGTPLMVWILGFMGTVIMLPFLYLRFQREGWRVTVLVTVGCGISFYFFFGIALNMPLYPGLIYLKIIG
jgi:hypothetical protein